MEELGDDAPTDAAPAPEEEAAGGQKTNVTPEEQAQLQRFVHNGQLMIYDQKAFHTIVDRLKSEAGEEDPVGTLAQLSVMIVKRLYDSAQRQIDPAVMFHGGIEIMGIIADLSKDAKAHEYTDEEKEAALYKGMDQFRAMEQQSGGIDQKAAQADWENMRQADQGGEIDKGLPDARAHFEPRIAAARKEATRRPGLPQPGGNRKARRAAAAISRKQKG